MQASDMLWKDPKERNETRIDYLSPKAIDWSSRCVDRRHDPVLFAIEFHVGRSG